MSRETNETMRYMIIVSCIIILLQSSQTLAFSSDLRGRAASVRSNQSLIYNRQRSCHLYTNISDNDEVFSEPLQISRHKGRKRALLRKYGKAIALSTTLMYGPMASAPLARRLTGSTAQAAASTVAPSKADYNFQDFKDVKKKLSLAPGADAQKYQEILERVEVEGETALKDMKPGDLESALKIGGSDEKGSESVLGKAGRGRQKAQKKQSTKQQVSDWESDEFGFGDEDEDEFEGVMNIGSSTSKLAKGARKASSGSDSSKSDVVIMDKMAYNNYQEALGKEDQMKTIKKLSFYSILPVGVITLTRGQIRAYKEKKRVKRGLALFEQEKKEIEEEMKRKGNKDDDDGDDDDDDDDY